MLTAPQIAQKIADIEKTSQAAREVSKNSLEHEEWTETTTKSQETCKNS